jgi:hypothetical protein
MAEKLQKVMVELGISMNQQQLFACYDAVTALT